MPTKTSIEWTDYSVNPLRARNAAGGRGWSCQKISPGCLNCYSEAINKRFGNGLDYDGAGVKAASHYLEMKELGELLRFRPRPPFKNGRDRCMVFPFDMTDVFGHWVPDSVIDTFMATVALRPDVDFMVLTKRADRLPEYFNAPDLGRRIFRIITKWLDDGAAKGFLGKQWDRVEKLGSQSVVGNTYDDMAWPMPLPNWWQGVSAEDQTRADHRLPLLQQANVAVRFVSWEPLLGPIEANEDWFANDPHNWAKPPIDLGIIGGESGAGSRPCNAEWVRSLIGQHQKNGVACFVKQLGAEPRPSALPSDVAVRYIKHSKGGDPAEWPLDLRVRQFPKQEQ